MKKEILKYLIAALLMLVLFSSCEEDEPEFYDSAILKLSASSFSVLDAALVTEIDFVTTTKTVTDVVISLDNTTPLYTVQAVANKANFTLLRSDLGLNKIGDKVKIYVNATVDGKVKEMYTTISMVAASSISGVFKEKLIKEKLVNVLDDIYELSSVNKFFTYEVNPKNSATVVNVEAFTKVGKNGTFTSKWSKVYDKTNLKINFVGTDFNKNDTLFVRLIASSGTFRDTANTNTVIMGYELGDLSSSVTLDTTYLNQSKGYDLLGDSIVENTESVSMIEFTHDFVNLYQGFTVTNNTVVLLNATGGANLPELKAAIDASSTTTVSNVAVGQEYIVKHTRNAKVYYGILEIAEINDNREGDNDFITFNFAFGEYDLEN